MSANGRYVPFFAKREDSLLCGLNAVCNALNKEISVESMNAVLDMLTLTCSNVKSGDNFGIKDKGQIHIKTLNTLIQKEGHIMFKRPDLEINNIKNLMEMKCLIVYGWYWDGKDDVWAHYVAIRDGIIYDDAYAKGQHGTRPFTLFM